MKKRVLSLCMAFILSFSMMPMTAFAEGTDAVTEQQETQGSELPETVDTTDGSASVEDISGGNAGTKDAAVEAVQALIDALPEEVTADNADRLQAQLMAIDEALAALDKAQTARLNMTRLENIYAALNVAVAAAQATTHVDHSFCGATNCQGHGSYSTHHEVVSNWIPLSYDEATGQLKMGENNWDKTSYGYYILPKGNYYLETDLKTDATITIQNVSDEINLCLNGHSITAAGNFDVITQTQGEFRLCDCKQDTGKITHQAETAGRGVCSNAGLFYMYGGTITGNNADNKIGGGVYVANYFHIFGGIISDNKAAAGGGVYGSNSVFINGGFIQNNTATLDDGGGVYIGGKMTMDMYDVTITNNKASRNGGGVYLGDKCAIGMSNVTITGNNAGSNGGGMMLQTSQYIDMRDKVEITGNTVESKANNLYLKDSGKINVKGALTDSKIGVSLSNDENDYVVVAKGSSYSLTSGDKDVFDLDDVDAGYVRIDVDNSVAFQKGNPHKHGICGKEGCTEADHDNVVWKGINNLNEITEDGNYYLKQSVTLSSTWICKRNVKLCLNDKSIIMEGANDAIKVAYGKTFTLCNCGGNGTITHSSGKNGRGVYVETGSFTMYSGSITGNTAGGKGGGVNVGSSGSFTMYGGSIKNNTAGDNGGGVYAGGTITVSGGAEITDNNGSNVYLPSGKKITVGGALSDSTSIGVTMEQLPAEGDFVKIGETATGVILTDEIAGKFSIDNHSSTYRVQNIGNSLYVVNGDLHEHGICGKEGCSEAGHGNVAWIGVSKLDEITSAGYYYLKNDIELTNGSAWEPESGVVLCLNGHSITQMTHTADRSLNVINVKNGNTFTLSDCKEGTGAYGKITHKDGEKGSAMEVASGSNFNFYGGCITGNDSEYNTVSVYGNFYMYDGEIKGNASSAYTTVFVYSNGGTFNMSGGSITGNSVGQYGGVGVNGAITVSGDVKITGNVIGGTKGDDGLYTGGTTSNVYLSSGRKITVGGALSDSASIGVTSRAVPTDSTPVTIATAADNWIKDGNFTTDNSLYKVNVSADGKIVNLGLHEHQWKVRVKTGAGNILEEYCDVAGCTTVGGTLTLDAENQKYSGKAYDSAKVITVDNWTQAIPTEGEIFYTDSENKQLTDAPVKAGTYYANVTVDGVTAKKKFTISRWKLDSGDIEYTAPDQDSLIYDGSRKEATVKATKPGVGEITVTYYNEASKIVDPINAGTYTVRIEVAESDGFEGDTLTNTDWKFTIAPKPVTITGISAQSKFYDGTVDATITGKPVINGLVTGDEGAVTVDATNATATFADADAGTAKKVTFTGYALTDAKAGNYTLSAQPASVTADISPQELTITAVTVGDKDYDGTTTATVTGVTFNGLVIGEFLTRDKDYTVTGNFADAVVGDNKDVAVTVNLMDSVKNYTLSNTGYTKNGCKIVKAAVTAPAATDLTIINGSTTIYTVMLPQLLPSLVLPQAYGSLTYDEPQLTITDNSYQGTATVRRSEYEYGKLALQFTDTGNKEGPIGTITVKVHSDNYEDITLTINILATAKIVPQLEGTLKLTPSEITYGEKLSNITISGTMTADGSEITGTFAWDNPDAVLNAGNQEATWKFTPDDTQTYAETPGTTTVRVNKAEQSGAVLMDNYTYNETPKTPGLTERKGDTNAAVTYYYSTTRTNSGGTEWKDITPTTLKAGTYYMYAVIGETGNYKAYTTETKAFTVWKAAPVYTKPSGLTAKYGQKLSEIALTNPAGNMPGTWSWDAPDTVIDKTGTVKYDAYFTPDDTNYKKVVGAAIEITVTPGDGRNLATEELTLAFNDGTDHTYTPDWSELPAGQTWNYECEPSIGSGSNAKFTKLNVSAADGGLTYAVSDGKVGDKITVILKACCSNYKDFTITLNIQITKAAPAGEPKYTLITTEGKTLADAGLTLNGSTLNPAAGTLEWVDADGNVLSGDTEVEVNKTYKWRFTPADTNYEILTGEIELYHVDAPAVTAQPKSVSVTVGDTATFEVAATGTDVTYQWQIDRNDGNGFVNITGATGATYTTGVTDRDCNGFKYRCVISNAAGSATTDTVVLTVLYQIIEGANGSWNQSTDGESLRIRGNGEYSKFQNVKVDGNNIDSKNYTVSEGSTIIELHADYLKTLSEGSHTFEIVWTDGAAGTSFTVAANTSGNNSGNNSNNNDSNHGSDNSGNNDSGNTAGAAANTAAASAQELDKVPATGDPFGIWLTLFAISLIGLAGMLARRKKN